MAKKKEQKNISPDLFESIETQRNKQIEKHYSYESQPHLSKTRSFLRGRKIKLKSVFATIKKMILYGKPFHLYLYIALFAIIVSTFFELLIPVYLGYCIDSIIGAGAVDFNHLWETAILLIIFVCVSGIFSWVTNVCTNKYCYKSAGFMREIFFKKMNSVPLKFIDKNQHGDLLSRMINDVDIMTDGILEGLSTITNGIVTIAGTLIFMFILNVPLAILVLIITPMSLVLSMYIAKKSYKLFAEQARSEGEINGYLEEFISGGRIVKAFNYEKQAIDDFQDINQRYYKYCEKAEFFSNLANPVTRFINGFVYVAVAFAGTLLAINGAVTIGLITSFLSYANSFGKPFNELSVEITELQAAFASSERVFSVLEEADEPSDLALPELASVDGQVSVKDASFSYDPKKSLIEGFNLEVAPGEKVAIVGPTGCGKTTFINLLMRFYDLNKGGIYLDGVSISEIKRNSLRNKYGMVLQESWLYTATIRENIAYGKPNATMEEIIEVSKLAGVDDFVSHLPKGYETMVAEGGNNISQGQKQLICIARIMLLKPPMLILDEATSNIDTRTEMKIQQAFDVLMKGRTTFIVAHRLSTIKSADIILVMNKGNIIEQGKHFELLEKKGFYYKLYNSQFAKPSDD